MSMSIVFRSCLVLSLAVALLGCKPKPRTQNTANNVLDSLTHTRSDLDQAYDMLGRMNEFERGPASETLVSYLSNFLSRKKPAADWKPDSLVGRLPPALRSQPPLEHLAELDIQPSDPLYLEEAYLLRGIGNWAIRATPPLALEAWTRSETAKLDKDQAETLLSAYLLFDWAVRNIQLDPLPKAPADVIAGPTGTSPAQATGPAPLRGVVGPGYTALPWFTTMCGHGDTWQRMRVFTLLCRQQGIDAVTLAFPDPDDSNRLKPWTSAVLIESRLYLFDPTLGLPIPGPDLQGIATLEQVRADGGLLRALDVDAEHPYDVSLAEVQNITALIDASPESLSQRMKLLEQGLAGERQLKLTIDPSDLAQRLRKSPGIANVALWAVPIEAVLFDMALRQSPQFDPLLRQAILTERGMIERRALLGPARIKQLHGAFADSDDRKGANSHYLESRGFFMTLLSVDTPSDLPRKIEEINAQFDRKSTKEVVERTPEGTKQLEYLLEINGMLEFLKSKQGEAVERARFNEMKNTFTLGRDNCSYWLGLGLFDAGNYKASVDWLDDRTLAIAPNGFWTPGARYNLARAYEALGATSLAQDLYIADESPQQHGSLLRAKWLAKSPKK